MSNSMSRYLEGRESCSWAIRIRKIFTEYPFSSSNFLNSIVRPHDEDKQRFVGSSRILQVQ